MIPSLRYLCLEKVIALDEDCAGLPEILIKDINLMKVFNGTYVWGDFWVTIEKKIFYDGKAWNFKSRTWYHESDGEGEDGKGVCSCKYCWDTTGCNPIDFTVKEGEAIQEESSILDFLRVSRLEQEDEEPSGWKFKVELESNEDKDPWLVKEYGEVKSLGAIAFYRVGQGETTVCGRFQAEVINTPVRGDWPSKERTFLHLEVTGIRGNSVLYSKDEEEAMHVSWWRDPTTREIHIGVNSFDRI